MSTFYDRLLVALEAGKVYRFDDKKNSVQLSRGQCAHGLAILRTARVVRASNVFEWCEGLQAASDMWATKIECAPVPFPNTWVEFNKPHPDTGLQQRIGVLARARSSSLPGKNNVTFSVFDDSGEVIGCFGQVGLTMDSNYSPLWEQSGFSGLSDERIIDEEFKIIMGYMTNVALMTFQLMNCPAENVPRELVTPPAGLSKKWRKKHGRELVKYYTLDVGPDASERRKAQQILDDAKREGRAPPRLHWVRGHFKRGQYVTPERPQGRYCRPFLRGSSASGIVVKDYNVRAPQDAGA